jgi:hypothetical protein
MNQPFASAPASDDPTHRNDPPWPPATPTEDAYRQRRAERAERRAEVTVKSVQMVLLCLGGLLLTAGIIVFTAVAWRQLGDGGRLTILAGATGLLLVTPLALTRFRLWATAETLAAIAVLALWCSALAGYYLYLPSGTGLTAVAVARWTALVLIAAILYRMGARVSSPGWALLPLAAAGTAFAAFGDTVEAALHMGAIGAVLAAAAAAVKAAPTRHAGSDQWATRVLLTTGIAIVFLAGLRAAFGLDAAFLPVIAATACLLASSLLLATAHASSTGASRATVVVLGASAAALSVTAWVLAFRAEDPLLAVPSFGLAAAGVVLLAAGSDPDGPAWLPTTSAAAVAVASLASVGAVVTGAFALTAYFGAALLTLIAAFVFPAPLSDSLRKAAALVGAIVLAWCAGLGLSALPVAFGAEPNPLLRWEIPAIAAACAVGVAMVRKGWRRDYLAVVVAIAAMGAGGIVDRPWAPVASLALVSAAALLSAFTSPGPQRRVTAWIAAYVWLALAAVAAVQEPAEFAAESAFLSAATLSCALLAAAHVMRAVGGPGMAARVGAHGSIALYLACLTWMSLVDGVQLYAPLGFLAYAMALAVAALAGEHGRVAHVLGSFGAATAAQLLLTHYSGASTMEYYTVPPAALLFGIGLWLLRRNPDTGSWAALSPAIAVGFGPSLVLALGPEGEPWRRIAVGAAALALLLVAANRRWQAPLVLATLELTVLAVNEIALVWSVVPKWAPLSVGGAILIVAGATLEQRRRDLSRLSRSVKAMR